MRYRLHRLLCNCLWWCPPLQAIGRLAGKKGLAKSSDKDKPTVGTKLSTDSLTVLAISYSSWLKKLACLIFWTHLYIITLSLPCLRRKGGLSTVPQRSLKHLAGNIWKHGSRTLLTWDRGFSFGVWEFARRLIEEDIEKCNHVCADCITTHW